MFLTAALFPHLCDPCLAFGGRNFKVLESNDVDVVKVFWSQISDFRLELPFSYLTLDC